MEASHSRSKVGNTAYSGARNGCLGPVEYQKNVLAQQMKNILLSSCLNEEIPSKSTSCKAKKKLKCDRNFTSVSEATHRNEDSYCETLDMDNDIEEDDDSQISGKMGSSCDDCISDKEEDKVDPLVFCQDTTRLNNMTTEDSEIEANKEDLMRHAHQSASHASVTEINFQSAAKCVADRGCLAAFKAH